MKKWGLVSAIVTAVVVFSLFALAQNPVVFCKLDLPEDTREAIKSQAEGVYSHTLPLLPVFISVKDVSEDLVRYTIYYFPFGTVGMSFSETDGYCIEEPLMGL